MVFALLPTILLEAVCSEWAMFCALWARGHLVIGFTWTPCILMGKWLGRSPHSFLFWSSLDRSAVLSLYVPFIYALDLPLLVPLRLWFLASRPFDSRPVDLESFMAQPIGSHSGSSVVFQFLFTANGQCFYSSRAARHNAAYNPEESSHPLAGTPSEHISNVPVAWHLLPSLESPQIPPGYIQVPFWMHFQNVLSAIVSRLITGI